VALVKKILFATHENIDKTAVAKAMFYDVAVQLRKEYRCVFFSASNSSSGFIDEAGIERLTFARKDQGKISIVDLLGLVRSFFRIAHAVTGADMIYIRSYPMMIFIAWFGYLLRKKIIFDTRGLFFDELYDSGKIRSHRLKRFLKYIEFKLLNISDDVICVSEAQKAFYLDNYKSDCSYHVVYNCAIPASNLKHFNDNKLRICYVGSLIDWHCPDLIRNVLLALTGRGVFFEFHCITKQLLEAEVYFGSIQNVKIYEHDYRNYPIKFDLGFCLIRDTLSKHVCFPVKFAEYIAAETPVVFSNNVDVCCRILSRHNVGVGVDLSMPPHFLALLIEEYLLSNQTKEKVELPKELQFSSLLNSVKSIIDSRLT
jgi:glycosyltransferase involved in cell wall biosynthesis